MGPQMRAALKIMKSGRFFTTGDLEKEGFDWRVLKRLKDQEVIHSPKKGVYYLDEEYVEESGYTPHHDFENFALGLYIGGETSFINLYSAANYHELTVDGYVQNVTLGVDRDRGRPASDGYKYKKFSSGSKTTLGIETIGNHRGVPIRITGLERTVVDLIYYSTSNKRDEIDSETAADAFSTYMDREERNPALLEKIAREFGVENQVRLLLGQKSRQVDDEGTLLSFSM